MKERTYQCPRCKSPSHRIDIEATMRCALIQTDDRTYLDSAHAETSEESWGDQSPARCCKCDYSGRLRTFRNRSARLVILHAHRCPTTDEPLFWNNQDGWVGLPLATVFSEDEEKPSMPLEAWGVIELP